MKQTNKKGTLVMALGVAVILATAGCGSKCDEAALKAKHEEINSKMAKVIASGDISKIMGLTEKMKKISATAASGDNDLQAACEMADEILDELD